MLTFYADTTTSGLTVAAKECASCTNAKKYDASLSTSYNLTGPFENIEYADGTLSGDWVVDRICPVGRNCTLEKFPFLAATKGALPDVFKSADGVMGLAPSTARTRGKNLVTWLATVVYVPEAAFWFEKKAATDPKGPTDQLPKVLPDVDFDTLVVGQPQGKFAWADLPQDVESWTLAVQWMNIAGNKKRGVMFDPTVEDIFVPLEDLTDFAKNIPLDCKTYNYTHGFNTHAKLDCDCKGKEFTVRFPTFEFMVGGLSHAYINLQPQFYYYRNSTGQCAFHFVGTSSLSGRNLYVFGQKFHDHVQVVHHIGSKQIGFRQLDSSITFENFAVPDRVKDAVADLINGLGTLSAVTGKAMSMAVVLLGLMVSALA